MAEECQHSNGRYEEKKEMEVQLFEDPVQDGIELYDETYHFHASQIDEISLFKVTWSLSSTASMALTVKVEGRKPSCLPK